jgi:hypothetical protein
VRKVRVEFFARSGALNPDVNEIIDYSIVCTSVGVLWLFRAQIALCFVQNHLRSVIFDGFDD